MIGNLAIQTEAAKPAIGQIEMNLLAQPTLRPNAHAIADDQHADHQLRIDRGPSDADCKTASESDGDLSKSTMPVDACAADDRKGHGRRGRNHRTAAPASA